MKSPIALSRRLFSKTLLAAPWILRGQQAPLRARADQQITELTVHGWDLAVATGQQADLDPALAEHALGWSRRMLRPELRGPGAFRPEVPVPPDAPAYQRLAGWFGRDPGWSPPAR